MRTGQHKRILALCVAIGTALGAVPVHAETSSSSRPNILFAFADDWGYGHAGVLGDGTVQTPTFDRVAREGLLFSNAHISSPSCTPSRGAVLTGQHFWRLGAAANLWSLFPGTVPVYPDLLAKSGGYFVGHTRKGWGPGRVADRAGNPAGPAFATFAQFLERRPAGQPFCFWFGSQDPHRGVRGDGAALRKTMGIDPAGVVVPPMLPDVAAVREDIAEYYAQVQRFDADVGELLRLLQERGELDNTLVVISSDHGWSFPRGKANLYDVGTRVPLAVRWPAGIGTPGRVVSDFVSIPDLAATFLEVGGVTVPGQMTARSILPLLTSNADGRIDPTRDHVLTGRERHTPAQEYGNNGGYPMRAIRTDRFLYIRNYKPERWPVGTPDHENAHTQGAWLGDADNGQTKFYLWANRDHPDVRPFYDMAYGKRPAEELYDIEKDPHQFHNVAADPAYAEARRQLADRLTRALRQTGDPRELGMGDDMDKVEYFGGIPRWPGQDVIDRFRERD
jgi:N-sulfoglucosamine sulfohydrolase